MEAGKVSRTVLRKKSFVATGYEKDTKESLFFWSLNSNERVWFSEEYSTLLWDDLANELLKGCIDF